MTSGRGGDHAALARVLAVVEGSSRVTDAGLAPGVQAWLASPEQGLRFAIGSARGTVATVDALARLAPSRLSVLAEVTFRDACWAEVTRSGNGKPETCLIGTSCDLAGQVTRVVWLRAPVVPPTEVAARGATPDARPLLESYFAHLMSSRFAEAAAHFSVDTIYSHPPYAGGHERVLFRGRDALRRGFETERGPSPARQIVTALWQRDSRVFVEGVVEGIPNGGTFFSTAQITPQGEIARYVAFYTTERIPTL
jgi:hypothetical protein